MAVNSFVDWEFPLVTVAVMATVWSPLEKLGLVIVPSEAIAELLADQLMLLLQRPLVGKLRSVKMLLQEELLFRI